MNKYQDKIEMTISEIVKNQNSELSDIISSVSESIRLSYASTNQQMQLPD